MTKHCKDCGLAKGAAEFNKCAGIKDGLSTYCRECQKVRGRLWRQANREKHYASSRRHLLMSKYGITPEQYRETLDNQRGLCALCLRSAEEANGEQRSLAVDHNHLTGKSRGLLCRPCNTALASLERDPEWCSRASRYLEIHTDRGN